MDDTSSPADDNEFETRRAGFREAIGRMVQALRGHEEPPLSQGDLAARVGVSRWTISQLELGNTAVGFDVLFDIFAVFGRVSEWAEMMEVVMEDDWRPKPPPLGP